MLAHSLLLKGEKSLRPVPSKECLIAIITLFLTLAKKEQKSSNDKNDEQLGKGFEKTVSSDLIDTN